MTVFLDAHVLLWAIYLPERLSEYGRQLLKILKQTGWSVRVSV